METVAVLAGFWITHLAAVASPGPSFLVVSRASAAISVKAGLYISLGLTAGTLVWALGAWFGLAALFAYVPALWTLARLAGAAYLLFLAWQIWRGASVPIAAISEPTHGSLNALEAVRLGVLTQIANPKVAVFFGSVFAAILPPSPGEGTLIAVFVIVCANEFLWYAAVALLLSRPGVKRRYMRMKASIDRVTAGLLAALGLRLLLED